VLLPATPVARRFHGLARARLGARGRDTGQRRATRRARRRLFEGAGTARVGPSRRAAKSPNFGSRHGVAKKTGDFIEMNAEDNTIAIRREERRRLGLARQQGPGGALPA
jgi:hypothetical protein